ncbi:hypothetical protein CLPU_8c01210 [Gottschalkia purinilytica]|uniref:Uncharacterized protein n=1 Tax=Gottschalkia purinilytica TaxID=1503 RepID=A0A0L0WA64_GOTPU|nr:hypothetical protein [Gottschalkia purinilytica]KNF08356.1 hypothetical protein CLPU_8c01210 [Gottschalkia purinilytica]
MKGNKKYSRYFIIALVLILTVFEFFITKLDPINKNLVFYQNDFSKTVHSNPEMPWKNIFYGSSIVAGAFMDEKTSTDYVNMGIRYGKITDLEEMLKKNMLKVEDNIVIGMNVFTFLDELPTDPYYIWHKKIYEPYLYFYRGPILKYIETTYEQLKNNEEINQVPDWVLQKQINHGRLSKEELDKKKNEYKKRYGNLNIDDFNKNIESLKRVIDYCDKNNIRLRAIWMPWNPVDTQFSYVDELKKEVNSIFNNNKIEVLDWTNKYEEKYFHDLGHLNFEEGAPKFTEEIDKWLSK